MLISKKIIFTATVILVSLVSFFINTAKAADPPAGCSGSSWISPTQYQGYYYCAMAYYPCAMSAPGWKIISTTQPPNSSHGCNGCGDPDGCGVEGILWEKIPPPTCTLIASPSSIGGLIQSSTLSWNTTAIDFSTDSAIISNNKNTTIITATATSGSATVTPTVDTVYTMTVTNTAATATCSATVSIVPLSCTIKANPSGVFSGSTAAIDWTAVSAISGTISDGTTSTPLTAAELAAGSGSFTTPPITGAKTYSMTVNGIGGSTVSCGPAIISLITPPVGGLIPCGRLGDDPATSEIDESKPCDLCSMLYTLKKGINFMMQISLGIAILIIIISGLMYSFSAGDTSMIGKAKNALYYTFIGLIIMFIAWIIIASILKGLGYADITTWNQVNCVLQK